MIMVKKMITRERFYREERDLLIKKFEDAGYSVEKVDTIYPKKKSWESSTGSYIADFNSDSVPNKGWEIQNNKGEKILLIDTLLDQDSNGGVFGIKDYNEPDIIIEDILNELFGKKGK